MFVESGSSARSSAAGHKTLFSWSGWAVGTNKTVLLLWETPMPIRSIKISGRDILKYRNTYPPNSFNNNISNNVIVPFKKKCLKFGASSDR